MLRVALNGRFSGTPQPTGTQTAAFQLFDAIIHEPHTCELVVFADSRFPGIASWKEAKNVTWVEVPFQDWSRGRAQLWEQFILPRVAKEEMCQVAHHPITTCPVWHNGIRHIVTLHDLNFYRYPEWYSLAFRFVYACETVPGLKRADWVVTISDYVLKHAVKYLHISKQRLSRVYNGANPMILSSPPAKGNYLLCVGSLQPHKNLIRLIRAYRKIAPEFPGLELRVVGRPQPRFTHEEHWNEYLHAPGVHLLGYLSEEDLSAAYAGARVFCYPSLEEGFGLPVLEAMVLGTPVLTSNVSCLPEVSGPAATLVDPFSEDAIAEGLRKLLRLSPSQHDSLVAQGREWAAHFSWKSAAQEYLKLYRKIARKTVP